ncbi:ABC transporter permease [Pyrobaculum calidifontis]|uniref:ABC-2 type transporter n=1 Tax=Pyrobaculum calidifontis (strain DSM 21063 / JCM 11548 / VA1) TaxID=410359 RepID=A3MSQ0_PYRCJ|nr:ABC transporter permease [Pyrobaculum calidifontis]ABO07667.1 ABC-2 type transporter [Pyrobaculum calidifontis JCM 11548]
MIGEVYALYKREVLKLVRSRYMWIMIVAQPLMWILFFGNSLAGMPSAFLRQYFGVDNYLAYMLPGMISILMMSTGMFASMSLVFDKRVGYLKRILVTPTPKAAIHLAKALGAVTRGLLAAPVILLLGAVLGVQYTVNAIALAEWLVALVAAGVGFASLFTALTANTADVQAPGVVMNFITMPLMFTSTALFPRQFFPTWLQAISDANPLTYLTEIGRSALVYGAVPPPSHFAAVLIFAATATALGAIVVEKTLTAD